jgi:hypothetical protein
MSRTAMSRTATSSAWLFSIVLLAGCQTTNDGGGPGKYAVPANYRQLVAHKVIEGTKHIGPVRSATISQPAKSLTGYSMVCATTTNEGRFIHQTTRWLIFFENGQILSATANPGAIHCASVPDQPFPEVVQR